MPDPAGVDESVEEHAGVLARQRGLAGDVVDAATAGVDQDAQQPDHRALRRGGGCLRDGDDTGCTAPLESIPRR
ncbi:MAG: hypothetical protein ABS81_03430 [Pseudonocardia sp. SCN 72-86]|nr:MAG: hypothetical protein ABS81_03430 [Pseudonocardia sp. SCN 72-86]